MAHTITFTERARLACAKLPQERARDITSLHAIIMYSCHPRHHHQHLQPHLQIELSSDARRLSLFLRCGRCSSGAVPQVSSHGAVKCVTASPRISSRCFSLFVRWNELVLGVDRCCPHTETRVNAAPLSPSWYFTPHKLLPLTAPWAPSARLRENQRHLLVKSGSAVN